MYGHVYQGMTYQRTSAVKVALLQRNKQSSVTHNGAGPQPQRQPSDLKSALHTTSSITAAMRHRHHHQQQQPAEHDSSHAVAAQNACSPLLQFFGLTLLPHVVSLLLLLLLLLLLGLPSRSATNTAAITCCALASTLHARGRCCSRGGVLGNG
jgi:hypothetical protein